MQQNKQDIRGNNKIYVSGKIASDFTLSHKVYGEEFYKFFIEVPRLSEVCDLLPVTISERLIDSETMRLGAEIFIKGQIRSCNTYYDNKNHLILSIFVKEAGLIPPEDCARNPNTVTLNGFLCKMPSHRETPLGRKISDILLAVNRPYNKSDYIPIIVWGRNSIFAKSLKIGDNIKIEGRMQSRDYEKKLDNGEVLKKTAYEVSVSKMALADEDFW